MSAISEAFPRFNRTRYFLMYGATKAAPVSLSSGVKAELSNIDVTVSVINPPFVDMDLQKVPGFPRRLPWYDLGGGLKIQESVAEKAVCALERGKTLYVPGLRPRFIHLVLVPIPSRWLVNFLTRFLLKGSGKEGTYRIMSLFFKFYYLSHKMLIFLTAKREGDYT